MTLMVSIAVIGTVACSFGPSEAFADGPRTLLVTTSFSGDITRWITSVPLLDDGRLGPDGTTVTTRERLTIVASPMQPFVYIASGIYSTRGGRLERQGEMNWSSLTDPYSSWPAIGLSHDAPVLAMVAVTRPELRLRFLRVHPETGVPDLTTERVQSLGMFVNCAGTVLFSWSGDYLWHSKSDCYKGTRFARLPFSRSELRVLPQDALDIYEPEMVGPAITRDDRFAVVGGKTRTLKTYALDRRPGGSTSPPLAFTSQLSGQPWWLRSSPGGRWVAVLVDGKVLTALEIGENGEIEIRDALYLEGPQQAIQLLFASENVLCIASGERIDVIRFAQGRLALTDVRIVPGLASIAIAGY